MAKSKQGHESRLDLKTKATGVISMVCSICSSAFHSSLRFCFIPKRFSKSPTLISQMWLFCWNCAAFQRPVTKMWLAQIISSFCSVHPGVMRNSNAQLNYLQRCTIALNATTLVVSSVCSQQLRCVVKILIAHQKSMLV